MPGPPIDLLGLLPSALAAQPALADQPAFRARQVFEGLHAQRKTDWEAFTTLAKPLRARLAQELPILIPAGVQALASRDGSTKHVLALEDGLRIEAVHMPYEDRTTLCLSSQVGCALGCTFCATGRMGLRRNLLPGEIVGQVYALLRAHPDAASRPVNLVFMGMGEPLHNLEAVLAAFEVLTHPLGMALPPRRITLSTAGLVPGIEALARRHPRPRLALSLNATTDAARSAVMPVNRTWNLEALSQALARFPLERDERVTLEYVLIQGSNDSIEDAVRLVRFARAFPSKVNLIPLNAASENALQPPDEARIEAWCRILSDAQVRVAVRRSRGQDVRGACGQLAQACPA